MIPLDQKKIIDFKSGLYVVSTPIGNLMDITLNAIEILKLSNLILCEDTRVSKKILDKYNIKNKELFAYHKFNEKKRLNILSSPGPSSVISSVSISGFSDKFIFYGFFPEKDKDIKKDLDLLSKLNLTIVFFVSAKKFKKISPYIEKYFDGRKIMICKELTKMYEQHFRFDVSKIKDFKHELRGEITLVLSEKYKIESKINLEDDDKKLIKKLMKKLSIKDVVSEIKKNKDISKKEIYNFCLQLKNEK